MAQPRCSIIVGAGLGDEGKGHLTDIFCNMPNTLNIRFNGGPQAKHTVVTPDGRRFAFRHLGAGTFTGAATYLGPEFLVNPVSFVLECRTINENFRLYPAVFVNGDAPVTTLYDEYINQAVEEHRDKNRHGSCGMGIWETVVRTDNPEYRITIKDLLNPESLEEKLKKIRDVYVPKRLKEEYNLEISDLDDLSEDYPTLLSDDETIKMYMFYVYEFLSLVSIRDNTIINLFSNLVFEGAQGLGLDENNPDCSPDFLTPSTTGVTNAMNILQSVGYKGKPDIYYVSRAYATRHGMGPLEHEAESVRYKNFADPSNKTNKFQGELRFAYIDFEVLSKMILRDMNHITIPSSTNLCFTCLDQLDNQFGLGSSDGILKYQSGDFIGMARKHFKNSIPGLSGLSYTYGLTRDEFDYMKV